MGSSRVKKIIHNPALLFLTLGQRGFFNWIPDEQYLKIAYRIKMGKMLDLNNPQTFNEKIQWLKLHDRRPEYTQMVDKIEAKKLVANAIGEEYIIPTLGVWNHFDEIDFDKLPDQFVLKCSHDSGGLVICRDKSKLDKEAARKKIESCLKHNFYWGQREWPYKNVKPRILAEKYMEDNKTHDLRDYENTVQGLVDYKFFCFDGSPKLLYISKGLEDHSTAEISFYSMTGEEEEFHRRDYKPYHNAILPDNFEKMKQLSERIARKVNNPFVRVDLYSINGKLFFSEITFSPCSGMLPFEPSSADLLLGRMIQLPNKTGNER